MSTRLVAIFSFLIFFVLLFTGAFGNVVVIWVGHEEILGLATVCCCQTPCQPPKSKDLVRVAAGDNKRIGPIVDCF